MQRVEESAAAGKSVSEDAEPARGEDPRVLRSRLAIVAAARDAFVADGYDASIDDIARRAGVAKRTIYNIYGDKETLFTAAILASIETAERFNGDLSAEIRRIDSPADDLLRFGVRLARDIMLGPVLPLRRLLIRESDHHPDLAAEYFQRAPGAVLSTLTDAMADLGRRGLLDVTDARIAAEHFAYLILGAHLDRALFTGIEQVDQATVDAKARAGVEVFLRAYLPR